MLVGLQWMEQGQVKIKLEEKLMEKYELKLKYKELVRQGKDQEAQDMLNLVRNFNKTGSVEVKTFKENVEVEVTKKKLQEETEFNTIEDLIKIDRIGLKNIKDIKRLVKTIDELKELIKQDKLPLRDDVVIKLKESLKL